jgi:hypothetical protein
MWFDGQGACSVSALVGPQHSVCHVDRHGRLPHEYLNKKTKVQGREKDVIAIKAEKETQSRQKPVSGKCRMGRQSEVWAKSSCGRSAPLGIGTEVVVGSDEIRQTIRCTRPRASSER